MTLERDGWRSEVHSSVERNGPVARVQVGHENHGGLSRWFRWSPMEPVGARWDRSLTRGWSQGMFCAEMPLNNGTPGISQMASNILFYLILSYSQRPRPATKTSLLFFCSPVIARSITQHRLQPSCALGAVGWQSEQTSYKSDGSKVNGSRQQIYAGESDEVASDCFDGLVLFGTPSIVGCYLSRLHSWSFMIGLGQKDYPILEVHNDLTQTSQFCWQKPCCCWLCWLPLITIDYQRLFAKQMELELE